MRILALSRYGQLGASSRQRIYQFLPYLEEQEIHVTVSPLLDDRYLQTKYARDEMSWRLVAGAYLRRLRALFSTGSYDLVWIEKEALPWLPGRLERFLAGGHVPMLIDYDDAVFHQYDQNRKLPVRKLLGRKIDYLMRRAELVIACNDYIAGRAAAAGARKVRQLPTVVDPGRYQTATFENKRYTIGWIGTPGTQFYLDDILPVLVETCRRLDARLHVIGGSERHRQDDFITCFSWKEASEGTMLKGLDTGIMPLRNGCWEQGKCGYKIIQYMAGGLPVVASAVGANKAIVDHGKDGFLVMEDHQWIDAFTRLAGDRDLRKKMGSAGRSKVETDYSLQEVAPRLRALLEEAAGRTRMPSPRY